MGEMIGGPRGVGPTRSYATLSRGDSKCNFKTRKRGNSRVIVPLAHAAGCDFLVFPIEFITKSYPKSVLTLSGEAKNQ
jgi:hypothetical protein